MTLLQRQALLLELIDQLQKYGSRCGETHIQKSVYFLQELLGLPLDFNYIYYGYGPYSFDLQDALTALSCDHLIRVQPRYPYGASLLPAEGARAFLNRFPKIRGLHHAAIRFVAWKLGAKRVIELERLATALYVRLKSPNASAEKQAEDILRLNPNVSTEQALALLASVNEMRTGLTTTVAR